MQGKVVGGERIMQQELIQAIINTVREHIKGLHTACPGKIISYDTETGLATVLPIMKFKTPSGDVIDYPQITGVPVWMPQALGQQATIAYPVKANDGCLVVFAEQSLDFWMYGQETDTDLGFDLTNAICIPGLFPTANPVVKEACDNNSLIIDVKGTRLSVKDGSISNKGNISIEGDLNVKGNTVMTGNLTTSGGTVNLN